MPSIDWRLERDLELQSYGSPIFLNPDSQEQCNDQDLLKRHHNSAKVTPTQETPPSHTTIYCRGA